MKKRFINVAMSIFMLASVGSMAACGPRGGDPDGDGGDGPIIETIDKSRTQIYVQNYNGGYGHDLP